MSIAEETSTPAIRTAPAVVHVDDSPADRYRRRKVLERGGFRVADVETGAAALPVIARELPDIVLLDVRLPDASGFDLTRAIKAQATGASRDIGVILISAYFTESEYRVRGLESGADAYLIEPISDAELVASVRAVARRVEQLKAARRNEQLLDARTGELRLADQAKNEFLATVVHELRQPINAAVAAVGVMKARADRSLGERARDVIERQLQQISRIAEDLLDATRIVRGQVALRIAPHDLGAILRRSVDAVSATAAERGVRLSAAVPADPVFLPSDGSRIEQVLVNLLSNGVRYTPRGGEVNIALEATAENAVIRIRDTGEGIAPERLPRIFDLFVRGPSSDGLGIGLAIARVLIEAHSGRIEAQSGGPGRGSEFTVVLPIQSATT